MNNTVIVIKGVEGQGKSETIKLIRDELKKRYTHTENLILDNGDIKSVITISDIKIGIESQGDPKSRQGESLNDFVLWNCNIIICACRTNGETKQNVIALKNKGYRLIWATNYRSHQIPHTQLNQISANHLFEIVRDILNGTL